MAAITFLCSRRRQSRLAVIQEIARRVSAPLVDLGENTPDCSKLALQIAEPGVDALLLFIHNTDVDYNTLIKELARLNVHTMPPNVFAIFFSGVGLNMDVENNDPNVKIARCHFDDDVKADSYYFDRLVAAAIGTTPGVVPAFREVDINAPCIPPVTHDILALDILVYGAQRCQVDPKSWFSQPDDDTRVPLSQYEDLETAYLDGVDMGRKTAIRNAFNESDFGRSAFALFAQTYGGGPEVKDPKYAPIHETYVKVIKCLCGSS